MNPPVALTLHSGGAAHSQMQTFLGVLCTRAHPCNVYLSTSKAAGFPGRKPTGLVAFHFIQQIIYQVCSLCQALMLGTKFTLVNENRVPASLHNNKLLSHLFFSKSISTEDRW
jgi:hypothetical protein